MSDEELPPEDPKDRHWPSAVELFKEYFDKRGVTADLRDENRIYLETFVNAAKLVPPIPYFRARAGFCAVFPYHYPNGDSMPYHTARIIQVKETASFKDQLGLEGNAKLVCPAGITRPYFPLNNPKITKRTRCVITESAVKAIVAANCGYYAIGLNGCWGFRSQHTNDRILPDLRTVPWRAFKDIVFVPDSDVTSNPEVQAAASRLHTDMQVLHRVEIGLLTLPSLGDDDKAGLDDYYAEHGLAATTEFLGQDPTDPPLSEYLEAMVELNQKCTYVEAADLFAIHHDNLLVKEKHFHNLYAPITYVDPDDRTREATRAWMKWEGRSTAKRVVFRPGEEPLVDGNYNTWRDCGIDPMAGDVDIHEAFLQTAIPDPGERRWLQQWIAYSVQKQCKMNTALVFYSGEQGTGKTMLAETIAGLFGRHNSARVSMDVVRSSFNEVYAGKQVVVINETLASDKQNATGFMDKLKTMITEETIMLHGKGRPAFEVDNHSNFILTTNHLNALKIDPSDRRFVVLEFNSQFRRTTEAEDWGIECWNWHREHLPELLHYYENFDYEDFNPSRPAPDTKAKMDMEEASLSTHEAIVHMLVNPETREETLEEYGIARNLRYLDLSMLSKQCFPGQTNYQAHATKFGNAFKKYGFERSKFTFNTPNGKITRRMYDLAGGAPDAEQAQRDYATGTGGKLA